MFEAARTLFEILKVSAKFILGSHVSSTDASAISTDYPVTVMTNAAAATRTLKGGRQGQIKIIICVTRTAGDIVVTPSYLANGDTITFNTSGDAIVLIFYAGQWNIIANYGCTIG
jgi:hypothetical protein